MTSSLLGRVFSEYREMKKMPPIRSNRKMTVGMAYREVGMVLSPLSLALRFRQKAAMMNDRKMHTKDRAATAKRGRLYTLTATPQQLLFRQAVMELDIGSLTRAFSQAVYRNYLEQSSTGAKHCEGMAFSDSQSLRLKGAL